jgi:hypothetical protein
MSIGNCDLQTAIKKGSSFNFIVYTFLHLDMKSPVSCSNGLDRIGILSHISFTLVLYISSRSIRIQMEVYIRNMVLGHAPIESFRFIRIL